MTILTVFIDFKPNGVCIGRFNQVEEQNLNFALKGDFFDLTHFDKQHKFFEHRLCFHEFRHSMVLCKAIQNKSLINCSCTFFSKPSNMYQRGPSYWKLS